VIKLNKLYDLKGRRLKSKGHEAGRGKISGGKKILVGKIEGHTSREKSSLRWEDNIKMIIKET
jgi:hypothetical protein